MHCVRCSAASANAIKSGGEQAWGRCARRCKVSQLATEPESDCACAPHLGRRNGAAFGACFLLPSSHIGIRQGQGPQLGQCSWRRGPRRFGFGAISIWLPLGPTLLALARALRESLYSIYTCRYAPYMHRWISLRGGPLCRASRRHPPTTSNDSNFMHAAALPGRHRWPVPGAPRGDRPLR